MKRIHIHSLQVIALLALSPLAAQADPPANGGIAVECDHRYISQRDAARVMNTDNLSQTYDKRTTLYANVARICHRGVQRVVLVHDQRVAYQHVADQQASPARIAAPR